MFQILYKLDKHGQGEEILIADLADNQGMSFVGFSHDMFVQVGSSGVSYVMIPEVWFTLRMGRRGLSCHDSGYHPLGHLTCILLSDRLLSWPAVTSSRACPALGSRRPISTSRSSGTLSRYRSMSILSFRCIIPQSHLSSICLLLPHFHPILTTSPSSHLPSGLVQVCKHLRFKGTTVPRDYEERFQRTLWVFRHQRVFCPRARALVHVRPLPPGGIGAADVDVMSAIPQGDDALTLVFLGPMLEDSIAQGIADGEREGRGPNPLLPPHQEREGKGGFGSPLPPHQAP